MDAMKIARATAIARLRKALAAMTPPGHSTCRAVTDQGVLCRGFRQDSQTELRMRYAAEIDISGKRGDVERRADEYQHRRQIEEDAPCSCDVQQHYYETCRGWDEFTNEDLARFLLEVCGEQVRVVS
jgi:hypothetical protein